MLLLFVYYWFCPKHLLVFWVYMFLYTCVFVSFLFLFLLLFLVSFRLCVKKNLFEFCFKLKKSCRNFEKKRRKEKKGVWSLNTKLRQLEAFCFLFDKSVIQIFFILSVILSIILFVIFLFYSICYPNLICYPNQIKSKFVI